MCLFSNRSQMTLNKVVHEAIAKCVTDVLTTEIDLFYKLKKPKMLRNLNACSKVYHKQEPV